MRLWCATLSSPLPPIRALVAYKSLAGSEPEVRSWFAVEPETPFAAGPEGEIGTGLCVGLWKFVLKSNP
jgi:hypothetical protein